MAENPWMAGAAQAVNAGTGLFSMIYNAANQQRTWKREDTAVRRRVADLKAAGLSPTLAAGSAAQTSGPIQMKGTNLDAGAIEAAGLAKTKKTTEKGVQILQKAQKDVLDQQHDKLIHETHSASRDASLKANALVRDDAMLQYAIENNLNPGMMNTPMGQAKMQLDMMKELDAKDQALLIGLLTANAVNLK